MYHMCAEKMQYFKIRYAQRCFNISISFVDRCEKYLLVLLHSTYGIFCANKKLKNNDGLKMQRTSDKTTNINLVN